MQVKLVMKKFAVLILIFIFLPVTKSYGGDTQSSGNAGTYDTILILDAFARARGRDTGSPAQNASYITSISPEARKAGSTVDYQTIAKIGNEVFNTSVDTIAAVGEVKAFEKLVGPGLTNSKNSEQAAAFIEKNTNADATPENLAQGKVVTPLDTIATKSPIEEQNAAGITEANDIDSMDTMSHEDMTREKGVVMQDTLAQVTTVTQAAANANIKSEEAKKSGDKKEVQETEKVAAQEKSKAENTAKKAAELLPNKAPEVQKAVAKGAEKAAEAKSNEGVSAETVAAAVQPLTTSFNESAKEAVQVVVVQTQAKQDTEATKSPTIVEEKAAETKTDSSNGSSAVSEKSTDSGPALGVEAEIKGGVGVTGTAAGATNTDTDLNDETTDPPEGSPIS